MGHTKKSDSLPSIYSDKTPSIKKSRKKLLNRPEGSRTITPTPLATVGNDTIPINEVMNETQLEYDEKNHKFASAHNNSNR